MTVTGQSLKKLLDEAKVAGPAAHDARIAAIRLSHRVTDLRTLDRDFSCFPGLKVRNILG